MQTFSDSENKSAGHYLSHTIYGLAQLPLIWVLWKEIQA